MLYPGGLVTLLGCSVFHDYFFLADKTLGGGWCVVVSFVSSSVLCFPLNRRDYLFFFSHVFPGVLFQDITAMRLNSLPKSGRRAVCCVNFETRRWRAKNGGLSTTSFTEGVDDILTRVCKRVCARGWGGAGG